MGMSIEPGKLPNGILSDGKKDIGIFLSPLPLTARELNGIALI